MASQPVVSIGLIGHVDHGKTTLLEQFSGKWADTHSEEIKRGITIRLGYADTTFYKAKDGYSAKKATGAKEVRTVSFVDAPGHESLMATMLAGATIIDGALLMIAANERCPQPQTREHLMALEIMGIKNVVVVQNKIDLLSEKEAIKNHEKIKAFLKGTSFEDAPIIPLSAQHGVGISRLIEAIEKHIPTPKRSAKEQPRFLCARSFDINKPGTLISTLGGGILGGSLASGTLKVGDTIEIRPGYDVMEKNQRVFKPLTTTITGLRAGGGDIKELVPGGSAAIMTTLDPGVVKSDRLAGSVVGHPGTLPPVHHDLTLATTLLDRVVGIESKTAVEPIKKGEVLMLNVNSASTVGRVNALGKNSCTCELKLPVCAEKGSRVTISRMLGNRFRLIGYGLIS